MPNDTAPASTPAQRLAWCVYDFGNSAFPTVIISAVYVLYFRDVVAAGEDPGVGDKLWGLANSVGAVLVFAIAPTMGAIADRYGIKRRLLAAHVILCVIATALLATTTEGTVLWAMFLLVVALYAFEAANVVYNAFLPELVPAERIPSLSARGWALGYGGGMLSLLMILGLSAAGVGTRWFPAAVAVWFVVFTLPTILALHDRKGTGAPGTSIWGTLVRLRGHGTLLRFLASMFFFLNGLVTVYVFAAAFANQSLGFTKTESIVLVLLLNLVAAPGALAAGRLAENIGARRAIIWSLWLWLLAIAGAVVAAWPDLLDTGTRKALFWGVAAIAALCIGATQATSRTFVGQIAPAGMSGEFYGFMALAGRAAAIVGPLTFGLASEAMGGDQRLAVASIGGFFAIGLVLLMRVPDGRSPSVASP